MGWTGRRQGLRGSAGKAEVQEGSGAEAPAAPPAAKREARRVGAKAQFSWQPGRISKQPRRLRRSWLKGSAGSGLRAGSGAARTSQAGCTPRKSRIYSEGPPPTLARERHGEDFFFFLRKRGASQRSESGMSRLQSEQVQRPCCRVDRGGMEETGVLPKDRGLGRLGSWAVPGNWSKSWGAGSQTERLRVKAGSQTCHSSAGSCAPPVLRWGSQR